MREITVDDLPDIARGAAVLGTGGGGDPYIGRLLAQQAMRRHGPVPLVDAMDLPDDAVVIPTAVMGAPTVMLEKLPSGTELVTALRALEALIAKPATHTVSIEAGGLNSVIPFATAAELGLHGTISLTQRIGVAIREAAAAHRGPVAATAEVLGGRRIFQGKLVDVRRGTEGGFARGDVRLEGLDADLGSHLDIAIQNENLVATRDGVVLASVPDLICVLDTDTGEPVTTEMLRYGLRVSVIVAPCDPRWRSPEGALTGPAYFGYDHEYVPV